MLKWDKRFMEMAELVSTWSKDPKTKVGAVIVNNHKQIVGVGYNGFARGVYDKEEWYNDSETKHQLVIHAEVNAIHNSNSPLDGTTMYCTLMPCPRCMGYIIQSGIKQVFYMETHPTIDYTLTKKQAEQAGVYLSYHYSF